ncbi:hypothetical protein, variant [Saprolegnia diclina VS20]|nr:hypothetical protein, variant [Saprolegnia diclina VS20]EQC28737.1 hypothetical protein, variant [Saprolegnia diclina VS20]|eukprot:XP_008617929.1 hypothetical protein, variant [Saprolegnia diclina VS20]
MWRIVSIQACDWLQWRLAFPAVSRVASMEPPREVPAVGRSRSTGPRVIVDGKNICALCRKQRQHGAGCPEGVAARKRAAKKRAVKLQKAITRSVIVHRMRRAYETPAGCRPLLVRHDDTRLDRDARREAQMAESSDKGGGRQVTPHEDERRSTEIHPRGDSDTVDDDDTDNSNATPPGGAVESQLLDNEWLQRVATLPVLLDLKPCAKTVLDRRLWPTWKYTISDPALDATMPTDPDARVFGGCDVYVWCPFTFFSHLIAVADLNCPVCGRTGVVAHGWCKGFEPVVSLDGRKSYLKYRRLRHPNCTGAANNAAEPHVPSSSRGRSTTPATRGTFFSSLDERLLQTWYPSSMVALLPFRHSGDRIVTLDVAAYTRSMQQLAASERDATPPERTDVSATDVTDVTAVDTSAANAMEETPRVAVDAVELHEARAALASIGTDRHVQDVFDTNAAASSTATQWQRALAELAHGEVNLRPNTKRKMRPCPECFCPNRAHRQRGAGT